MIILNNSTVDLDHRKFLLLLISMSLSIFVRTSRVGCRVGKPVKPCLGPGFRPEAFGADLQALLAQQTSRPSHKGVDIGWREITRPGPRPAILLDGAPDILKSSPLFITEGRILVHLLMIKIIIIIMFHQEIKLL
uniref:Uncharacterized protein n=1 Tax=Opuntia streptacantha TaxID=393608 RepID=A0A7C9EF52_OPUST